MWLPALALAARLSADPAAVDCLAVVARAEAAIARVQSYTAEFHSTEIVAGRQRPEQIAALKFMRPFRVYLKWLTPPHRDSEVLFASGWNEGRLRVRPGGFWGFLTLNLDPNGSLAMAGHRHPITDLGLDRLVSLIAANVRRAVSASEFECSEEGAAAEYGRPVRVIRGTFPPDPARGYYCREARVSFDADNGLPIRTRIYDWDHRLVEDYGYADLVLDAGLSDRDFDPANPAYRF